MFFFLSALQTVSLTSDREACLAVAGCLVSPADEVKTGKLTPAVLIERARAATVQESTYVLALANLCETLQCSLAEAEGNFFAATGELDRLRGSDSELAKLKQEVENHAKKVHELEHENYDARKKMLDTALRLKQVEANLERSEASFLKSEHDRGCVQRNLLAKEHELQDVTAKLKAREADFSVVDEFYQELVPILRSQAYRSGWDARDLVDADQQTPDIVDANNGIEPPGVYILKVMENGVIRDARPEEMVDGDDEEVEPIDGVRSSLVATDMPLVEVLGKVTSERGASSSPKEDDQRVMDLAPGGEDSSIPVVAPVSLSVPAVDQNPGVDAAVVGEVPSMDNTTLPPLGDIFLVERTGVDEVDA